MREQLILEIGCPRMLTNGPQLDVPLNDAITYPAKLIDEFGWEVDLPDVPDMMGSAHLASGRARSRSGVVGAIVPWNFPFEVTHQQAGPGAGHREHGGARSPLPTRLGTPPCSGG